MRQINNRVSDTAGMKLDRLAEEYESQRVALEIIIQEAYERKGCKMDFETEKHYQLDIYTWPAMVGTPVDMRTSIHQTPQEAIRHLDEQTEPYSYAVLQVRKDGVVFPCDWDGNRLSNSDKWPTKHGTNGYHPAFISLRDDWDSLVDAVIEKFESCGGGLIYIAGDILRERHPDTGGWSEPLADDAYSRMRNKPLTKRTPQTIAGRKSK